MQTFKKTATLVEAEKIWDIPLVDRWTKTEFPLSEQQTNAFFKAAADEGHLQQLQYYQSSSAILAAYANKKTLIYFVINKETFWGGENLTEEQKRTMKYTIHIAFVQRKDVANSCVVDENRLRCLH